MNDGNFQTTCVLYENIPQSMSLFKSPIIAYSGIISFESRHLVSVGLVPGSSRHYRLDVSQAQKAKESGDERPQLCASKRLPLNFLSSFLRPTHVILFVEVAQDRKSILEPEGGNFDDRLIVH